MRALDFAVGLTLLIGACGGNSPGTTPNPVSPTRATEPSIPSPTPPLITVTPSGANWSFRPVGGAVAITGLDGSFNISGDTVTAVLAPFGGRCFSPDSDRALFTGTRSGRAIQMRSQPLNGQVIDLSGNLSAVGDAFEGVYSIAGGCANGAGQALVGRAVNLSGVWVGTLGTIPTTVNLQMASTPDDTAGYALSGSVTFSNTQCFRNATITRRARGRWAFPDIVGETQRLELIVVVSDDLNTMNVDYVLVEGTCPALSFGSGRLVRR